MLHLLHPNAHGKIGPRGGCHLEVIFEAERIAWNEH